MKIQNKAEYKDAKATYSQLVKQGGPNLTGSMLKKYISLGREINEYEAENGITHSHERLLDDDLYMLDPNNFDDDRHPVESDRRVNGQKFKPYEDNRYY